MDQDLCVLTKHKKAPFLKGVNSSKEIMKGYCSSKEILKAYSWNQQFQQIVISYKNKNKQTNINIPCSIAYWK